MTQQIINGMTIDYTKGGYRPFKEIGLHAREAIRDLVINKKNEVEVPVKKGNGTMEVELKSRKNSIYVVKVTKVVPEELYKEYYVKVDRNHLI